MITDDKLREWEELADKATPGPWQACNGYSFPGAVIEGISEQHKVDVVVDDGSYDEWGTGVQKKEDASFIAASREAVPALIAEVRELRAKLKILTNPSDGRCMEIGALRSALAAERERVKELRSILGPLAAALYWVSDEELIKPTFDNWNVSISGRELLKIRKSLKGDPHEGT